MKLAPREARTLKQVLTLETETHENVVGWIMVTGDNEVLLVNQKTGEPATGEVRFTHAQFNRLIDWYNERQEVRNDGSQSR